jgi:hypothetical protein
MSEASNKMTALPDGKLSKEELEERREAIRIARAQLDAGLEIPFEDIEAWVASWDTDNELPPPQPRRAKNRS